MEWLKREIGNLKEHMTEMDDRLHYKMDGILQDVDRFNERMSEMDDKLDGILEEVHQFNEV